MPSMSALMDIVESNGWIQVDRGKRCTATGDGSHRDSDSSWRQIAVGDGGLEMVDKRQFSPKNDGRWIRIVISQGWNTRGV